MIKCEMFLSLIVPQPTVVMEILHSGTPIYAGVSLTLRCNVLVDETVDIPYRLVYTWSRSGSVLGNSGRIMISNATQLSQDAYYSTLVIGSLSRITDTGTYTCRVALQADSIDLQVQGSSQIDMESIIIQGMLLR